MAIKTVDVLLMAFSLLTALLHYRKYPHTEPPRGTFFNCSPMRTTLTPPNPD